VKRLAVLPKLLILTAIIGSLTACGTTSPYQSESLRKPATTRNASPSLLVGAFETAFINLRYGLSEEQKSMHTAAVYTALESDYGKVINWYGGDAKGAVKAVHGYPQGGGYCRVVISQITVKDKSRDFKETACTNTDIDGWRFISKR